MIDMIKKIKNNIFNNELIYLIKKVNDNSGFFYFNNKVIFMIKNISNIEYKSFETTSLSLNCNIKIINVEKDPSFTAGFYNIITFKDDINNKEFETFTTLCEIYANNYSEIAFDDFFFELSSIFQMPKEENFQNLIGFFGELLLMLYSYEKYGKCLADKWHISGSLDKYDFVINKNLNCEVKTTIKEENIFKIKHSQIFNQDQNFIIVINLEENSNGKTLIDLINKLNSYSEFNSNLTFQLRLAEELKKCNKNQVNSCDFSMTKIQVYSNKKLSTIKNIPGCISDITYDYYFDPDKSEDLDQFFNKI